MSNKPGWRQRFKGIFGGDPEDKDEKEYERTLHKAGIDFLKDQKLEHREKLLMAFEESMSKPIKTDDLANYVEQLKDRHDVVNHAIYEISAPFGRGGDIPRFSHMFHGWSKMNASGSSWIMRAMDIVGKTDNGTEKPKEATVKPKQKEGKDSKSAGEKVQETKEDDKSEDAKIDERVEELLKELEIETIDPRMLVQCLHDVLIKFVWRDAFTIIGQCFLDRDISPRATTIIQNVNAQREREDMRKEPDFS